MSHIDTWDPKPGRPTQGEFEPIKTSVPGMQISRDLPRAGQADAPRRPDPLDRRHQRRPRPGHLPAADQLQPDPQPAATPASARSSCTSSSKLGDLPAYITISGQGPRAGYLGQKCEAYFVGRPGEKDPYLAFPAGIAAGCAATSGWRSWRASTRGSCREARRPEAGTPRRPPINDAVQLMRSPALEAFELEKVKPQDHRALRRQRVRPRRAAGPPAGREGRAVRAGQPRRVRHAHQQLPRHAGPRRGDGPGAGRR